MAHDETSNHEPRGSIILLGHLSPDEIVNALEPLIGLEYAYMVSGDCCHEWGHHATDTECGECVSRGCQDYDEEPSQCWVVSRTQAALSDVAVTTQISAEG